MRSASPLLACLACALACAHLPPEPSGPQLPPAPAPAPAAEPPRPALPRPVVLPGVAFDYRAQAQGRSILEVAQPVGAQIEIFDAGKPVAHDTAPTAIDTQPDHWYRVHVRFRSGAQRDQKIQAVAGAVVSVRFDDVLPRGPSPMAAEDFQRLLGALDGGPDDADRLARLKVEAAHGWFTAAQAGMLLDHLPSRDSKLGAIPAIKDRLLDRENAWTLYQHFTHREDKARVQELLEKE